MDDRNRKNVSFVGSALSSTIKKYNKSENEANISRNKDIHAEYDWVGTFLRRM